MVEPAVVESEVSSIGPVAALASRSWLKSALRRHSVLPSVGLVASVRLANLCRHGNTQECHLHDDDMHMMRYHSQQTQGHR